MEKFIPNEKLSKKEKRKIDQAQRQTWGELNPVTRKPENSKAYSRRKSQNWKRELPPRDLRLSYCHYLKFNSLPVTSSTFDQYIELLFTVDKLSLREYLGTVEDEFMDWVDEAAAISLGVHPTKCNSRNGNQPMVIDYLMKVRRKDNGRDAL